MALIPFRIGARMPDPPAVVPDPLDEVVIEARGPRFAAPTRRDRIGRVWAPVYINGKGPFRLVLDTGATRSGISSQLADILGIPPDPSAAVLLRGVTGAATVQSIHVESLIVGGLTLDATLMPIVPEVMGGAQGILGTAGFADKRIWIDFRNDRIFITYSRGERAGADFQSIPFRTTRDGLIIIDATVGDVRTKAIIDTGGQVTIANLALRDALARRRGEKGGALQGTPDQIEGATKDIQDGRIIDTPPISFGSLKILDAGVTYSDLDIFTHWGLLHSPAIVIGMDALGLFDTLVIDYKMREVLMRLP